jgi:hypothetical protein
MSRVSGIQPEIATAPAEFFSQSCDTADDRVT